MKSGGEILINSGNFFIDEKFLVPTFEAVCGRKDPDAFEDTILDFLELLSLPRNKLIAAAMVQEGRGPQYLSELFRRFLIEGSNCPHDSYESTIRLKTNSVIGSQDFKRRIILWHELIREYEVQSMPLLQDFEELTKEKKEQILLTAQRLKILIEKFRLIEKTINAESNSVPNSNFALVMSVENQSIQDLSSLVDRIIEKTTKNNPNLLEEEDEINLALQEYKKAWDQFSNPFNFIESLVLLFAVNPAGLNLSIDEFDKYPDEIKAESPIALRNLISNIILVASAEFVKQNTPLQILFSWDNKSNELIVVFKDMWIDSVNQWNSLKKLLDAFGPWKLVHSSLTSMALHISVRLAQQNSKNNNNNSGNINSPPLPAGGEMKVGENLGRAAAGAFGYETSISFSQNGAATASTEEIPIKFSNEQKIENNSIRLPCLYDAIVIGSTNPIQTPHMPPFSPFAAAIIPMPFFPVASLLR